MPLGARGFNAGWDGSGAPRPPQLMTPPGFANGAAGGWDPIGGGFRTPLFTKGFLNGLGDPFGLTAPPPPAPPGWGGPALGAPLGGGAASNKKEPCKFYPNCTKGDSCAFWHPPGGMGGDAFGGSGTVECRFGAACTRADCKFKHSGGGFGSGGAGLGANSKGTIPCRYHPHCTNVICPYYHPQSDGISTVAAPGSGKDLSNVLCKYEPFCSKPGCPYQHLSRDLPGSLQRSQKFLNDPQAQAHISASHSHNPSHPGLDSALSNGGNKNRTLDNRKSLNDGGASTGGGKELNRRGARHISERGFAVGEEGVEGVKVEGKEEEGGV
ncbi:hypothetical protein HK097_009502 [Rhizophlyctis rosea]|uniref:C3H1-type domain-containing protein n=1 Tax=Rhizophlyctis rosea TaxID=64517 RepID=A0AAD5X371_9FUNG|nr:hypothetical protein HK097_009502 [Rhizophlyctis rosea]